MGTVLSLAMFDQITCLASHLAKQRTVPMFAQPPMFEPMFEKLGAFAGAFLGGGRKSVQAGGLGKAFHF